MSDNMILMLKDTPIMEINFSEGLYNVLDEFHLPFQLKGRIRQYVYNPNMSNQYNITQGIVAGNNNYNAVIAFLAGRVLSIDRANAKKILSVLGLEQAQDPIYRAKIAISCRAVSLQDNYWVKLKNDKVGWCNVDIHTNRLSNIVAQIALHGSSLILQGKVNTPELTTYGAYAKCWKREDSELYMYKAGFNGNSESKVEVEVSNILDKCNVTHLKYEDGMSDGLYCCKCKCMTRGNICMLSGLDFISYCNVVNLDFRKEALAIDGDSMYKMFIVDYLISNPDRHGQNWGFFYDCSSMSILGCHPLYDHNNAFDRGRMQDPTGGGSLFYDGKTLRDVALSAIKRTDFYFTSKITRDDFIVEYHYKSFMERAKVLGLV